MGDIRGEGDVCMMQAYVHVCPNERDARILFVQSSALKYLREWLCWPFQDSPLLFVFIDKRLLIKQMCFNGLNEGFNLYCFTNCILCNLILIHAVNFNGLFIPLL